MTENPNRILTEKEIYAQMSQVTPYFHIRFNRRHSITQREMDEMIEMVREFLKEKRMEKEPWE